MAVDFSKILSKQADEIEQPKPLPVGSYICTNPKLPDFKEIGKNGTPGANLGLVVIAPSDDVDPDDLKTFGDVKGKTIRHTLWLSEDAEWRTKEELVNAFGLEEAGKSLGQLFNETINKQVLVTIKHEPTADGTGIIARVEKLAAV